MQHQPLDTRPSGSPATASPTRLPAFVPPTTPTALRDALRDALLIALLTSPVWVYFILSARFYELDDALIYTRYIRNYLDHGQLVYNLGERFNGLTSPLFTLLSVAAARLYPTLPVSVNLLCGAFLLAASVTLHIAIATAFGRMVALLTIPMILFSAYFYYCTGMETSLFMFLISLSICLWQRQRWTALAVSLGLLLVTRNEGVFLALAVAGLYVRQHGFASLWSRRVLLLPLGLPTLLVMGWNRGYYGQSRPHTAFAKFGQGLSGFWGDWPWAFLSVGYHVSLVWNNRYWLLLGVLLAVAVAVVYTRRTSLTQIGLAFLVPYVGVFILLNVPNYHWYYAPFYMFLFAYCGVALSLLLQKASQHPKPALRRPLQLASAAAIAVVVLCFGWHRYQISDQLRSSIPYKTIGLFLRANTAPSDTVAAAEIGTLGWYSQRTIIDILGLVTPGNAQAIAKRDVQSWLPRYRPNYVVVHQPMASFEAAMQAAEERGDYVEVADDLPAGFRILRRRDTQLLTAAQP